MTQLKLKFAVKPTQRIRIRPGTEWFKIYVYRKSHRNYVEGVITHCAKPDWKGKTERHFDHLDEIPAVMREMLKADGKRIQSMRRSTVII